ncbi:MAG: tetratricopeptide repeat protein [Candidatus Uhrbacteria bacterium]
MLDRSKDQHLKKAQRHFQKGAWGKAICEYENAARLDPNDLRTFLKLGELYPRINDLVRAKQALQLAAEIYARQGFYLKAVAVYKQILKLDPQGIDVNVRIAYLYQQLGLTSDAIAQYQLVAEHHQTHGRPGEALVVLRRVVSLDPDNVPIRLKLGEELARQGQREEALFEYRTIAEQLERQRRTDDYIRVAERIIALAPEDLATTRKIAGFYLERGDAELALVRAQALYRVDPNDTDTLTLLVDILSKLGQKERVASLLIAEIARLGATYVPRDQRTTAAEAHRADVPKEWNAAFAVATNNDGKPATVAGDAERNRLPDRISELERQLDGYRKLFRVFGNFCRRIGSTGFSPGDAALRLQAAIEGNVVMHDHAPEPNTDPETDDTALPRTDTPDKVS